MNLPEVRTEDGSAAIRFARCWADFTKALSIYPATNMRVRTTLERMQSLHAEALSERGDAAGTGVAVLFRDEKLELNGEAQEDLGGGNLPWLRDRLDRAALAGVDFLPDLDTEAVIEFTKQLLRAYLAAEAHPSYEELWPEPFAGLALVDRRFDGGFGAAARGTGTTHGRGGGGGTARKKKVRKRAAASGGRRGGGELEGEDLVDVLMGDGDVMIRLTRIRALTDQRTDSDERVSATELLYRIVENMPAEALKDRRTFLEAAHEVLEALEVDAENGRSDDRGALSDDRTLKALLHSVSHSHFARSGPDKTSWARETEGENEGGPRKARKGDDEITDDVEGLLEELAALPEAANLVLTRDEVERPAEELTVCLHYLTNMGEAEQPAHLGDTLRRLLDTPGEPEMEALRACILADVARSTAEERPVGLTPIQSFLRSTNNTTLLRSCRLFSPEWVVEAFPRYFVPYLESVNPVVPAEMAQLDEVCRAIGPDRMIEAARETQLEAKLLNHTVVTRLLKEPTPARLALARLCLSWFGQPVSPKIAVYLRALDPEAPEAFLLYQFSNLADLTVDYLLAIIDLELGRADPRRLRDAVSGALCRHIRRLGTADPSSPERVESIRSLGRFPSPTANQMLRELMRGAWRPFSNREPGVVRRAARAVSRTTGKAA